MKPKKRKKIEPKLVGRIQLDPKHTWKAPSGFKIIVVDRGVISFNVPEKWILAQMEPLEVHDALPPDDKARITVSHWKMPPGIDWTGLPIRELLEKSLEGTGQEVEILERDVIHTHERTDIEIVWSQHRFMDPKEHREAFSRVTLARGFDVHALISFDFWVEDAEKMIPIWEEVARSLQMGRYIADPSKGVTLQ